MKPDKRETAPITFTEISEQRYWDMLGAVPPACQKNGAFLLGEAYDHTVNGRPRFGGFFRRDGRYYEADQKLTMKMFLTFTLSLEGSDQPFVLYRV